MVSVRHEDIDHTGITGVGGGTPDPHAASHESGGSDEIDVTGLVGAGGGGGGWDLVVDESGASIANFTVVAGTWASSGGIIQQTAASNDRRLRYTAKTPVQVIQCDVRIPSGQSGTRTGGIAFLWDGSGSAYFACCYIDTNGGLALKFDRAGDAALKNVAPGGTAENTWHTIKVALIGERAVVWFNGVYQFTTAAAGEGSAVPSISTDTTPDYIGLKADQLADFRNLKVWVPDLP